MAIDVARSRAETPGCAEVVHLNNAGASLMPVPVIETVNDYLHDEVHRGGYETAAARHEQLEAVYASIASLVGATSNEIAVVDNATRAWQQVFYALDFSPGDTIVTTSTEYASNYIAYLQAQQRHGVEIRIAPDGPSGEVDARRLASVVDGSVRLISMNHVPTNGGLVNDAAAVGAVARDAGVPFLLDACQSVGQLPVDVNAIGCDFLSATSRKFLRGPRGMGFLYVRDEWIERLDPPVLELHSASWIHQDEYKIRGDARRFESWEQNMAAKAGLGTAVDYALGWGIEAIWERVRFLGGVLRSRLTDIPGVAVHDLGPDPGAIVTFVMGGRQPDDVKGFLARRSINVSTVTPYSARVDMERRHLAGLVRASVHYFNTEQEIDALIEALEVLAVQPG